jgi:hypothetical protein
LEGEELDKVGELRGTGEGGVVGVCGEGEVGEGNRIRGRLVV